MEVFEIAFDALGDGVLAKEFAAGAAAAVITAEKWVREAWQRLVQNPVERLPWEAPITEIARNHRGGRDITSTIGDTYSFRPGRHAQIARKLELTRSSNGSLFECSPSAFFQGVTEVAPDRAGLEVCWKVGSEIMRALSPVGNDGGEFRVIVQRLKYQVNPADVERIYHLVEDSLGGWARMGYSLDTKREGAAGFLGARGVSDAYALLSLIPPFGGLLDRLNKVSARYDERDKVNGSGMVVSKAHLDTRYFSGLCGSRKSVRTEVFSNNRWIELDIGLDSICVIPGRLAHEHFGLKPILHRVIHEVRDGSPGDDARDSNVTLLVGAK